MVKRHAGVELAWPRRRRDAPLGALTTWRVGGPAAIVHVDVPWTDVARSGRVPPVWPRLVLGRGSNLLVADRGSPASSSTSGPRSRRSTMGEHEVTAGGATALPVLAPAVRRAAARTGLGFYVGIPGSVGGAVRMNAGGHGRTTAEVLLDATVVDLDRRGR